MRRPIHQARVVWRDSRRAESAEGEAPGPFGSLRIDSTESKSEFYLHTMEQMLVAAGAGQSRSRHTVGAVVRISKLLPVPLTAASP